MQTGVQYLRCITNVCLWETSLVLFSRITLWCHTSYLKASQHEVTGFICMHHNVMLEVFDLLPSLYAPQMCACVSDLLGFTCTHHKAQYDTFTNVCVCVRLDGVYIYASQGAIWHVHKCVRVWQTWWGLHVRITRRNMTPSQMCACVSDLMWFTCVRHKAQYDTFTNHRAHSWGWQSIVRGGHLRMQCVVWRLCQRIGSN